ncbi:MAG: ribokinase [Propionibacteriaceae bacterium]
MSTVVVGSVNADLNIRVHRFPGPGETLLGTSGDVQPGGKGANQALAAKLAGATDVTMIGCIGDDAMAAPAIRLLAECGVDLTHVATVPGPTGLAVVSVDDSSENTIVVIPGANAAVTPQYVASKHEVLADADIVIVQGEVPVAAIDAALSAAQGRVIVNLAPVVELSATALRRADPLVVNEHEAAAALGLLTGQQTAAPTTPAQEQELVEQIMAAGVRAVVMTVGSRGCWIADGEGVRQLPALKVEAVDTVGAGDAFVGALAAELAQGKTVSQAATFATRFAAASVQKFGAQESYPRDLSALAEVTTC